MENLRVEQITAEQGEFRNAGDPTGENLYFACYLSEKVFCYVQIILVEVQSRLLAVFHLTHKGMSPLILRAMRFALAHWFRPYLKALGATDIVGMVLTEPNNWARLMNLLGFDVYQLPDGGLYVRQEVG